MPVTKDLHHSASTATASTADRPTLAATERTRSAMSREAVADAHLIRLCLDLQLDAMLLAMGAAAATEQSEDDLIIEIDDPSRPQDGSATVAVEPPWHRWVAEDVQMACALAADVLVGGAALPPTLGSDLDHAVPAAAVDNLVARYESMASLLADVLRPARPGSATSHRPRIQEALARCDTRLGELRARRLDQTPPRGVPLAHSDRSYLPGELLG